MNHSLAKTWNPSFAATTPTQNPTHVETLTCESLCYCIFSPSLFVIVKTLYQCIVFFFVSTLNPSTYDWDILLPLNCSAAEILLSHYCTSLKPFLYIPFLIENVLSSTLIDSTLLVWLLPIYKFSWCIPFVYSFWRWNILV